MESFESGFLNSPYHYLLTMNVDWFEPCERGVYSVGVIYLTIQNLPREERYKLENVVLVGIIPDPREPKLMINSFLSPLVIDLKEVWINGISITSSPTKGTVTVKLALTCVACDMPASRKVCGFLSHNASLGCNKCYKKFKVAFGERTDYSGFDRENWPKRSVRKHREDVNKVTQEVTKLKLVKQSQNMVQDTLFYCLYPTLIQYSLQLLILCITYIWGQASIYFKLGLMKSC